VRDGWLSMTSAPRGSDVWQTKDLKHCIFGSVANKGVMGDFAEVWQAKGLEGADEELGDSALAGRTGRGNIPPDVPPL